MNGSGSAEVLKLSVLASAVLASALCCSAAERKTDSPASSSLELLHESYQSSRNFQEEQRAWLLLRLSKATVRLSPPDSRSWSDELFNLALKLPPSWNKVALQKNAVATLSEIDPSRAIQLFHVMDDPIPMANGSLPEDVRSDAARIVFQRFWTYKGRKGLPQIERVAALLADSGEYPYAAMVPIIKRLAESDSTKAQELFAQALTYYRRGSMFLDENRVFIRFLQELRVQARPTQLREALEVVANRLLEQKPPADSKQSYRGQVFTKGGAIEFRDPADQMLFEILPLIREVDSDWANRLVQRRPALSQTAGAVGPVEHSASTTTFGIASGENVSPSEQAGIEEGRLYTVHELAAERPDEALTVASTLTLPAFRAQAWADIAAALASKDRDRALALIDKAREVAASLRDQLDVLRVLSVLCDAGGQVGDRRVLQESLEQGLDLGEEIFNEDLAAHPGKLAYNVDGFDELTKLVQVGGKYDTDYTVNYVRQIRNELLRAHLLVSVAEGISSREAMPTAKDRSTAQ